MSDLVDTNTADFPDGDLQHPPAEPRPIDPGQAAQLLAGMHQALSHDLPNQLVVVLGLARLLEVEEKETLSPQAMECLSRLGGAARRASAMVQVLKDMARLGTHHEPMEIIQLANLGREIHAEIKQFYPERTLTFDNQWRQKAVRASRRSLHRAILEVLRCGIDCYQGMDLSLRLSAQTGDHGDELEMTVGPVHRPDAPAPAATPAGANRPQLKSRLELCLAAELAATWGGKLDVVATNVDYCVRILVPFADG